MRGEAARGGAATQSALDGADWSALWGGGTCPAAPGDESPGGKAATSRRTPHLCRLRKNWRECGVIVSPSPALLNRHLDWDFNAG